MPSDASIQSAIDALRRPIATYRSYVAAARERARAILASDSGIDRARLELGSFGATRIDVARFAELRRGAALDALSRYRLERASVVLAELDAADDSAFVAAVPAGDSLRVTVARALARLGRAFGATAVVELVRGGRYEPERHDSVLEAYAFERWTKAERAHAPPLIVTVDGADLRAGALTDLLDVGSRLLLLVRGAATPAPLVRLITPGTLVMQTRNLDSLARVASADGPAIAALFEQEAALFTHDPAAGRSTWQRLTVSHRPTPPKKSIAGLSPRQQQEELLQLDALAEQPALPDTPVDVLVPGGAGDPTERLAAWLLDASGLTDGR